MTLLQIIGALIIVGGLLWLITFLPWPSWVKQIINAVAIVFLVLWILGGLFPGLGLPHVSLGW